MFPSDGQSFPVTVRSLPDPDDYRPDVTYNYTIQQTDTTIISEQRSVTFDRIYWIPGHYDISVNAHNLLNSTHNSTTFRILDRILDVEITNDPKATVESTKIFILG